MWGGWSFFFRFDLEYTTFLGNFIKLMLIEDNTTSHMWLSLSLFLSVDGLGERKMMHLSCSKAACVKSTLRNRPGLLNFNQRRVVLTSALKMSPKNVIINHHAAIIIVVACQLVHSLGISCTSYPVQTYVYKTWHYVQVSFCSSISISWRMITL